jgi:tetraacyldisaccharide 4'-kinase
LWECKNLISFLLLPASAVFWAVSQLKRHNADPVKLPVPVIVVGNIYIGGTGKTPVTIALVRELQKRGWTPGVISRGYRGRTEEPVKVQSDSNPDIVGDEPLLIYRSTLVPTYVHSTRVLAAKELLKNYPEVDVIVSDDGLQHYALDRDFELAVVGARGLGNGWVLPAGPLRETPGRLNSVDAIVLNATDEVLCSPTPRYAATSGLQTAVNYATGEVVQLDTLSRMQSKKRLTASAVAGIALPNRFFSMLRAHNLQIKEIPLADHYGFDSNPFEKIDSDMIFLTEKDAVKCRKHPKLKSDERLWVVPLEMVLDKHLIDQIEQKIGTKKK